MEKEKSVKTHTYICIDLKSFYASVECVERGLDPLGTNLVVADPTRTEKTICLAVTPSLKAFGIPGRARLFEVVEKVRQVNDHRRKQLKGREFTGKSADAAALEQDPTLELDYVVAPPQMRHYMEVSGKIYSIYLQYVAPEDIFPYSVDEVFIDVTAYLNTYKMSGHALAIRMIRDVMTQTGITATAGIGTNPYLAKVAMDIVAKHMPADRDGVRIAELDEMSYRRFLWTHTPLTDFWRIGVATARKLAARGLYTMGDIARCSLEDEDILYRMFGVNAELLIDHAWGWEPTTIPEIKSYRPKENSLSTGQVLKEPYPADKARLIVHEMTDLLVLDLVKKGLVTDQMVLHIGYDIENLQDETRAREYVGEVTTDWYGRKVPKHAHGSVNLPEHESSSREIIEAVLGLFDRITDPSLTIRRINVVANHILPRDQVPKKEETGRQLDLFSDFTPEKKAEKEKREKDLEKEEKIQQAILSVQKKYGKNALLKGMNLEEGATSMERNSQIGGHKA
ncbi:MAG: DNA methylase [Eubacterium sp.]|nr:DNA methylase [Eubacterium sp.]